MRISGGIAKGRRVIHRRSFTKRFDKDELRPTSAKVREAIFDILGDRIVDCRFLDLYAGTGAVGLEALSRGAGLVVFVDESPARIRVIADLIKRYGFVGKAHTVRDRAARFVTAGRASLTAFAHGFQFDVAFVDPPYASGEIETILPLLGAALIMRSEGLLLAEHSSKITLPVEEGGLRTIKRYQYGDTALTLFILEKTRDDPLMIPGHGKESVHP